MARIGRPPKDEATRKSNPIAFRLAPQLREQLQAARGESGRSLSEEIEARLRLSFGEQQRREDQFGGPTNYWLFRLMAEQLSVLQQQTANRWWEDSYTYDEFATLAAEMLSYFKPPGRKKVPKHLRGHAIGRSLARVAIGQLEMVMRGGWDLGPARFNAAGPLGHKLKKSAFERSKEKGHG